MSNRPQIGTDKHSILCLYRNQHKIYMTSVEETSRSGNG